MSSFFYISEDGFAIFVIFIHFSQVAPEAEQAPKTNQYTQAEHGKTEMSLLHFTLTNPGWKPTGENERYLAGIKEAKGRDLAEIQLQVNGSSLWRHNSENQPSSFH